MESISGIATNLTPSQKYYTPSQQQFLFLAPEQVLSLLQQDANIRNAIIGITAFAGVSIAIAVGTYLWVNR